MYGVTIGLCLRRPEKPYDKNITPNIFGKTAQYSGTWFLGQTETTRATLRQKRVYRFCANFSRRRRNYVADRRHSSSFRQTSGPEDENAPRPQDRSKKVNPNVYGPLNTTAKGGKKDGRGADDAQCDETGGQTEATRRSVVFSPTAAVQTELTLFAWSTRRATRSMPGRP